MLIKNSMHLTTFPRLSLLSILENKERFTGKRPGMWDRSLFPCWKALDFDWQLCSEAVIPTLQKEFNESRRRRRQAQYAGGVWRVQVSGVRCHRLRRLLSSRGGKKLWFVWIWISSVHAWSSHKIPNIQTKSEPRSLTLLLRIVYCSQIWLVGAWSSSSNGSIFTVTIATTNRRPDGSKHAFGSL